MTLCLHLISSPEVWREHKSQFYGTCTGKSPLPSLPLVNQSSLGKALGESARGGSGGRGAGPACSPREPHALTSSLCPSSRRRHAGRSRRDCPRGRSTRARWGHRWRTRCSRGPRTPPGKRPAEGGSQCASAPPRPRGTAPPPPSPGTRPGLQRENQSEQRRAAVQNPTALQTLVMLLLDVLSPRLRASTHDPLD